MKLRYILFSSIVIAAVFCVRIPGASAADVSLTCSGADTNQCNANCTATASDSDTPSSYIDYIYREGPMNWDDYVTWGAVVNNAAVFTGNHGVAECGVGGASNGTVNIDAGQIYQLPGGTGHPDAVSVVMTAFQKRTTDVNPYHGTVGFDIHHIYCTAGQIVVGKTCQPVTGSVSAHLDNPSCTGSCPIDVSWLTQPYGVGGPSLNNDIKLYIGTDPTGTFWSGVTGLSGTVTSNPMSTGTYTFCIHGFDGNALETGDLACQSVTVPPVGTKTATLSVSTNTVNLSSGTTSGGGNISNSSATNSGSFTPTCTVINSNFPTPSSVSVGGCAGSSLGVNASESFSATVMNPPSSCPTGTCSATLQIQASGDTGTVVANPTQPVTITYTPASTPGTCSPGGQTVAPGQTANFTGGSSNSTWSVTGGSPSSGTGATFATSFATGNANGYNVQLNSNGTNSGTLSLCHVNVPSAQGNVTCSLVVDPGSVPVGGTTGWFVTSSPTLGYNFYWHGTDSVGSNPLVDIGSLYGGTTDLYFPYTYTHAATYTRSATVVDANNNPICTTNTVTFTVGSGGTGGNSNNPPPPTPPSVSFSINGHTNSFETPSGTPLTLTWSSANADSCSADINSSTVDPNWTGTLSTSGSKSDTSAISTQYDIHCYSLSDPNDIAVAMIVVSNADFQLYPIGQGSSTFCSGGYPFASLKFDMPSGTGGEYDEFTPSGASEGGPSPVNIGFTQGSSGQTITPIYVRNILAFGYANWPGYGAYDSSGDYWYTQSNSISVPVPWCSGSILLKATLDGNAWSGSLHSSLAGPQNYSDTSVPTSHSTAALGTYVLSYTSGGPAGATLNSIFPNVSQILPTGSQSQPSATYTMNFTTTLAPTNGSCGTANKTYPQGSVSYGSDTYCADGNPSSSPAFPAAGNSATWTCSGTGGGTNSPQCTAINPASQYSVTVTKTTGGSVKSSDNSISCGSTCSGNYTSGTVVTLTATPDSSYWQFSGWSGDCNGTAQCVLNVTSAKAVTATFAPRNLNYQEF